MGIVFPHLLALLISSVHCSDGLARMLFDRYGEIPLNVADLEASGMRSEPDGCTRHEIRWNMSNGVLSQVNSFNVRIQSQQRATSCFDIIGQWKNPEKKHKKEGVAEVILNEQQEE